MPTIGYAITYPTDTAEAVEALAVLSRKVYDDLAIVQTGSVWSGFRRDRLLDTKKNVKRFRQRHVGLQIFTECRPGDVLIFPEYDRTFRELYDFYANARRWIEGGVRFIFLDMGLDSGTEIGLKAISLMIRIRAAVIARSRRECTRRISSPAGMGRPVLGVESRGHKGSRAMFVRKDLYDLALKVKEWVSNGWSYHDAAAHLYEMKVFRSLSTRPGGTAVATNMRSSSAWEAPSLKILVGNLPLIDEQVLDGKVRLPAGWKPAVGPLCELPEQAPTRAEIPESHWLTAKKLGKKVKEIRRAKGLVQLQLAKACGMTQSQLSEIETGEHLPLTTTLARLAKALGVTMLDFQERPEPAAV